VPEGVREKSTLGCGKEGELRTVRRWNSKKREESPFRGVRGRNCTMNDSKRSQKGQSKKSGTKRKRMLVRPKKDPEGINLEWSYGVGCRLGDCLIQPVIGEGGRDNSVVKFSSNQRSQKNKKNWRRERRR